jgi:MoaA/NifB/PqqE/SkfB family radical SAM enzyme
MGAYNKLRLLVTDDCQLACHYCHEEARRGEDAGFQLGYDGFCSVLDAGRVLAFESVRISGGEPLICLDLTLDLMGAALERGFTDVGLTTNGVLLPRHWPRLRHWVQERGIRVGVTLNATDPKAYVSIAQRPASTLQMTLQGLQLLKDMPRVKVITVVNGRNFANLPDILRTSAELGITHKIVDTINPPPGEYISIEMIEDLLAREGYRNNRSCDDYEFFENYAGHTIQVPHRKYYARCMDCPMYPCREGDLAVRIYPGGMVRSCFGADPLYITQPSPYHIAPILEQARLWSTQTTPTYAFEPLAYEGFANVFNE